MSESPTVSSSVSSRISGFYNKTLEDRLGRLIELGLLSPESARYLKEGGGLETTIADRMSENVISCLGLPFSVGLNFSINGRDVVVPMAVEEPSVVAAASNAARLVRQSGGFKGEASASLMTAQVQLDEVIDVRSAATRITDKKDDVLAAGNAAIPRMVARGGGCQDIEVRIIDEKAGVLVVHVYIDVGNAMGANMCDSVAEAVAPTVQSIAGGRMGLRILTNLGVRRMVKVEAPLSTEALGSEDVVNAIARASRFAELDPYRAVTHNKGIMNGIDAAAVALGQDWRAIEAGAHGYAAMSGQYRPLATWEKTQSGLLGTLEMPLACATVGGSTKIHPGVRAAFELVQAESTQELAIVIGSVGLACNLAALKALASEGIQKGHMRLHARKNG